MVRRSCQAFSLAVGLENAGEVEGYNFTLIQRKDSSTDPTWGNVFNFKIDDEIIDNSIFNTIGPDTKQFTGYNLYISTRAFTDTNSLNISTSSDNINDAQVYAPGVYNGTTINVNEVEVASYSDGDFILFADENIVTITDSFTICISITEGCTIELVHSYS